MRNAIIFENDEVSMSDIQRITEKLKKFRDDRDWMQFHNHKDMALSLALEAAEVLEHFQWKSPEEVEAYGKTHKGQIGEELADVAAYLFELADNLGIDLAKAMEKKIKKNAIKYPINKAKGKHTKYSKLK
jgi:NTP pyrophosphatase (non-canonical NTP hydrolase)